VKKPFFAIILIVILVGLFLSGLGDTAISVADTSIPGVEVNSSVSKASNSSASGTITITMTGVLNE